MSRRRKNVQYPKHWKDMTGKRLQLGCTGVIHRHGFVVREEWSRAVLPGGQDREGVMRSVRGVAHGTNGNVVRGCMKCGTPDLVLDKETHAAVLRALELAEPGHAPLRWDLDRGRLLP